MVYALPTTGGQSLRARLSDVRLSGSSRIEAFYNELENQVKKTDCIDQGIDVKSCEEQSNTKYYSVCHRKVNKSSKFITTQMETKPTSGGHISHGEIPHLDSLTKLTTHENQVKQAHSRIYTTRCSPCN